MMNTEANELYEAAKSKIETLHKLGIHHIGAAVKVSDGTIYSAVHLETYVGALAVCGEVIAIGMAIADGHERITAVAAVNQHGDPVSPCGRCRELIADYSEDAHVVLPKDEGLDFVPISELLPNRYRRRE